MEDSKMKPTPEQILIQAVSGQRDQAMTQVAQLQTALHIAQERIQELELVEVQQKASKKGK